MQSKTVKVSEGDSIIPLPAGKKYYGFKVSPSVSLYRYCCGTNPDNPILSLTNSWGNVLNLPWPIGDGDYIVVSATSNSTTVTIAYDE